MHPGQGCVTCLVSAGCCFDIVTCWEPVNSQVFYLLPSLYLKFHGPRKILERLFSALISLGLPRLVLLSVILWFTSGCILESYNYMCLPNSSSDSKVVTVRPYFCHTVSATITAPMTKCLQVLRTMYALNIFCTLSLIASRNLV